MSKKQKLELTWIGKDNRPRLEPRILLEDKTLSYRADAPIRNVARMQHSVIRGNRATMPRIALCFIQATSLNTTYSCIFGDFHQENRQKMMKILENGFEILIFEHLPK